MEGGNTDVVLQRDSLSLARDGRERGDSCSRQKEDGREELHRNRRGKEGNGKEGKKVKGWVQGRKHGDFRDLPFKIQTERISLPQLAT